MTWATIESFLKDHGLTETETQVYIFIAKNGVLKNREISNHLNKDRAQTLRIIKNLQNKGLVESTLEVPQRFTAIPFEKVLEAFVKEKREEANLIENTKQELLNYWKNIKQTKTEQSLTKFNVIKGNKKIYLKIAQMIKETTNQLSFITTVNDFKRATQYGIFESEPKMSPQKDIQLHFITEISDKNISTMKSLLKTAFRTGFKIKGRNPDLGSRLFPRMVIRDNAETIFFIKSKTNNQEPSDLCLWTNCTELAQAFTGVFEELWNNSTDIELKIKEIETDTSPPKTSKINDLKTAHKKHIKILKDAQKEIIMITSTEGLNFIAQKTQLIQSWIQKNISVKIMAPITIQNKQAIEKLLKSIQIRHVPFDYFATTIVDEKYLLQFKNTDQTQETPISKTNFENIFFTTDLDYIIKTKNMLNEIWKNSTHPSTTTISSIFNPQANTRLYYSKKKQKESAYDKLIFNLKEKSEIITEKHVLNKLINAKKYPLKNWPNKPLIFYGSTAHAVIHPPKKLSLPEIMIWIMHLNKQSSFGAEDLLVAYLRLKTDSGYQYVPVVSITDNSKTVSFRKKQFAGTPASNNIHVIKKEEFQVRVHGDTFFAGWTVPIPLYPTELILTPSCLLLEGHSKLTSGITKFRFPSGIRVIAEHNGFDAFVTYFHPESKYSGPGTDGRIHRDIVTTFYHPESASSKLQTPKQKS